MEHDLITRDDVEEQVCPVLLQLTEPDSGDDFRTEAVTVKASMFFAMFLYNVFFVFLVNFEYEKPDMCLSANYVVKETIFIICNETSADDYSWDNFTLY